MNKTLSIIKFIIGWPLAIISLFFIFKLIYENSPLLLKIQRLDLNSLILSFIFFFLYFVLRAILWSELVREKGNKLSLKKTFYFWEISEIKRYTPGNIWSFLSRANLFSKNNILGKEVFSSLITEAVLIVLSSFFLSYFYLSHVLKSNYLNILLALSITLSILIFTCFSKFDIKLLDKLKLTFIKNSVSPSKNITSNLKFYSISVAAFFMYSIATYFGANSVFYLNLRNFVEFSSLFAFAFLVGYISIITPMGLGVREGVVTFGLSSFVSLPAAGLISIFTRIIFIISEVIFVTLVFLWNKIKSVNLEKIERFILDNKYEIILIVLCCFYVFYYTTASFLRYDNFYTGRFDLGNMDQTVWNSIHGRIFQLTDPDGTNSISRLSVHADFILILISPLYLIWSNPKMLLLLQTITLAIGGIIIFFLSKNILKNKNISLILATLFLINPAVGYTNLYEFHPVTLATTLLLATFYFFYKKKYVWFFVFAILSSLCKEEIWAVVSVFGLYLILKNLISFIKIKIFSKKEFLLGLFLFILFLSVCYYLITIAIPAARGSDHFALSYYSDFGSSPSSIVKTIILNPSKTILTVLKPDRLFYLGQLFLPLIFLPLLSLEYLFFAVPDFLVNLLSNNNQLHQIYYQYSAGITPFLFIATIFSIKKILGRFKFIKIDLLIYLLIFSALFSAYSIGPLPFSKKPNVDMFKKPLSNTKAIDDFLANIPTRYSIAASNNLGSHLSHRRNIYTIPLGIGQADVILFLLNDAFAQPSLQAQKEMVKQMSDNKNYIQVYQDGDFVAFEKRNLYTNTNSRPKKGQASLFPYSITAFSDRSYQKSDITIEQQVPANGNFTSFIVSFTSDGLKEYALMNIPDGNKPANGFPVLILDHGYVQPNTYDTVNSYKSESDYFTNQGFLVLKPDYRGNGNSEIVDTALMRFAYPIDVLNLISSVGNISAANPNKIFLWSHSMGGEVTLEVLEASAKNKSLSGKIKGAMFWAPVTDPVKWFSKNNLPLLPEAKITPYPYSQTFQILGTPEQNPKLWQSLSPLNYLPNINVPILLQHGTADTTVPYSWSVELDNKLKNLNKNVEFLSYPNDTHNLPNNFSKAVNDDLNFINKYLTR